MFHVKQFATKLCGMFHVKLFIFTPSFAIEGTNIEFFARLAHGLRKMVMFHVKHIFG